MARYIQISCPRCLRSGLKIRPENLGRRVQCKHCAQAFVSSADLDADADAPRPAPEATVAVTTEDAGTSLAVRDDARARLRASLAETDRLRVALDDARERIAARDVAISDLEQRLAAALDELAGAADRARSAEAALQALRERRARASGGAGAGAGANEDAQARIAIESLTRELQDARHANQRLALLLDVLGMTRDAAARVLDLEEGATPASSRVGIETAPSSTSKPRG